MSSPSAALNANLPSPDIKGIVAETKRVVELWGSMNNARMPIPLKESCQRMVQQMEDSLRESSKVANKEENWIEKGLQMWKENRKEAFQETYVRKGRGEAEAVISALRGARKAADKLLEQIESYLEQAYEKGASGRSTTTNKSLEIMQEIVDCRERMDFSSLIKLWFYVDDEILSCIEKNLDHMNPAISFLGEQVENQWVTLGQIYFAYATEFRITGLDHDIELARKKPSSWAKFCTLSRPR